MIRIAVMYPNQGERRFDLDYYREQHLPLVKEKYSPYGLKNIMLDTALSTSGPQAAPYLAIGYLLFDSVEQFMRAYKAEGAEVMEDLANFTEIEPVVQISHCMEVVVS